MTFWDYLDGLGLEGFSLLMLAMGVLSVFIIVYLFAAPGKEISFLGIKFTKRVKNKKLVVASIPDPLPDDWVNVLLVFSGIDAQRFTKDIVLISMEMACDYPKVSTEAVLSDMESAGLIEFSASKKQLFLTQNGLRLVSETRKNASEADFVKMSSFAQHSIRQVNERIRRTYGHTINNF